MIARAAAAVVLALATAACATGAPAPTASPTAVARETATVKRQDLTTTDDLTGRLGYGADRTMTATRPGTVTYLAPEGAVMRRGQVLYRVNEEPTMLLFGRMPAWRPLQVGTADGADVRQLERNLAALGYFDRDEDSPDEHFDWRTREAVRDWQEDRGHDRTGVVALGDIVFMPGAVRVGAHQVTPGASVGVAQALATTSGTTQRVTMDVTPDQRQLLRRRQRVTVEMPDGTRVAGRVSEIGRVATAPDTEDGETTIDVEVTLLDDVSGFDAAPVTVHVQRTLASDVLTVPVSALVALAEGGYALELINDGGVELVPVKTGAFTDSLVEVTGEIAVGDEVVVPS